MKRATAIALCNAMQHAAFAATASLALSDNKAPLWVELLPAGDVKPADGRAVWKNPGAEKIIAASKLPFAIDYDHATDRAPSEGPVSRAAAWVEKLENRNGAIWGQVEWTSAGDQAVAAKEYRYLSPVFTFDKASRTIGALLRAALVNNPALPQLTALASQQENALDENLKKIAAALGLSDTATIEDILAKITGMNNAGAALASAQKFLGSVAVAAGLTVAADKIGEPEVIGICAKLTKTPAAGDAATVDDLQKQVATLSAQLAGTTATQEVDKAIAAGKLPPAQKQWAIDYCTRDAAGFAKFVEGAPVMLANGSQAPKTAAEGGLSDVEKATCVALGISEDDFKATAKAQKGSA